MSYKRIMGNSWEQAAEKYLDGEYINVILPSDLGAAIGCSPAKAAVALRSLGWYMQRDKKQNRNVYYRINPNRRIRI